MNKSLATMIAGSCMCATLLFPEPSLAAPPRTVRLEIDVEDLGDKGIGLDQTVRNQLGPQLTQANFELVDQAGAEAGVTLQVRFRALESGDYDYGVHFEFVDEGGPEPAIEWVDCHMCVDARLMPVLHEQTPALLAALDARVSERGPVLVPPPAPSLVGDMSTDDLGAPRDPGEAEPVPKPITGLGIGGTVIAGLGIGALIWARVELSRGVVKKGSGNEQLELIDHRPAGYALIGVGTTALLGGVIVLAVDLGRQTKKRERDGVAQAHVYPLLSPNHAGFGVSGNF